MSSVSGENIQLYRIWNSGLPLNRLMNPTEFEPKKIRTNAIQIQSGSGLTFDIDYGYGTFVYYLVIHWHPILQVNLLHAPEARKVSNDSVLGAKPQAHVAKLHLKPSLAVRPKIPGL